MERKVLGRGLEALISSESPSVRERVQMLKVDQVKASRLQPRLQFSEEKIKELAQSIKENGVIQPILVRAAGENQYELIAGERRLRAVKHLGIEEIPALVRRVADADLLEMSIVENIQREELNPIEEAKAYRRLAQEFGFSQDTIAERVGKDKSSVSNLFRILNLPEKIQKYLSENLITLGHAKALLTFPEPKRQLSFCERIIQKGLSVRQIELAASGVSRRKTQRAAVKIDANLKDLERRLEQALGTRVRIIQRKKRGRIEIEYYSLEDLDRVIRLLNSC